MYWLGLWHYCGAQTGAIFVNTQIIKALNKKTQMILTVFFPCLKMKDLYFNALVFLFRLRQSWFFKVNSAILLLSVWNK